MQPRRYSYVGPSELRLSARRDSHCLHVTSVADVLTWSIAFPPRGRAQGSVTATFIIDAGEQLWVADRRSEHVSCADGQDVLAAGEITFERNASQIHVTEVTNQSTGYCPEPSCWVVVARVLACLSIPHPSHFTSAFEFRRCDQCGATNLIKDNVFECIVCNSPLSHAWNYSTVA
jgi:hypothetical protein